MSKLFTALLLICLVAPAMGDVTHHESAGTPCASRAFADAMRATDDTVLETDLEYVIQGWIYNAFEQPGTLRNVLNCPEITNANDDETITFSPIEYTFTGGRHIVINYETQPRILKQKLIILGKRALPDDNPSPAIGVAGDATIWTNTEPAWYGILVVQSGALNQFVGADKNNTVSLKYITNNIDTVYPAGIGTCTNKSALAMDNALINRAMHETIGLGDTDSNDYYVAGDKSLRWIGWAQVAADVAITVATVGGGQLLMGTLKGVRAAKAARGLFGTIRNLERADDVRDYISLSRRADKTADITRQLRALENTDDVRQYIRATNAVTDIMKWRRALRAWKMPQRGNVVARTLRGGRAILRTIRAAGTGGKTISRAAKIGRAGMKSGKIKNWLFHSSLKNAARLAKFERNMGLMYGAITFIGRGYDFTEQSTGEFTNDIEFKPLGLLSADDLAGQENAINYGMWLMWAGDSINPADDDAAYLQAMDFADKFHQDLTTIMDTENNDACDIDIYVVRPIIREQDTEQQQLYYLIMNDTPWSTNNN